MRRSAQKEIRLNIVWKSWHKVQSKSVEMFTIEPRYWAVRIIERLMCNLNNLFFFLSFLIKYINRSYYFMQCLCIWNWSEQMLLVFLVVRNRRANWWNRSFIISWFPPFHCHSVKNLFILVVMSRQLKLIWLSDYPIGPCT